MPPPPMPCRVPTLAVAQAAALAVSAIAAVSAPALAERAAAPAREAPSAKDRGARYGQALGASLVCPFVHLLPAAEELRPSQPGADREQFEAEAKRVALVWQKTLACDPRADINRCRVLSEKSCSEAIRELGPEGTAVRGVLEFRR